MNEVGIRCRRPHGSRGAARDGAVIDQRVPLAMSAFPSSSVCSRSVLQRFEQRFGLLEIERIEALGESAVDRREQIGGLLPFAALGK